MSVADALVKLVSGDLTVWQVFATRSAVAIPCLMAVLHFTGGRVPFKAPRWVSVRSLLLIVTWLAYYSCLPVLPLAVAATAVYTNPIWTVLLSAYLLRERVLPTQWLGVALGFLGVAVVLRPNFPAAHRRFGLLVGNGGHAGQVQARGFDGPGT